MFAQGQIITTIAGTGTAGFSGDGGPATAAMFSSLGGMVRDKHGNLFVSDDGVIGRVRKITRSGIITTVAGGGTAYLGDGGPADSVNIRVPEQLAVDSSDNLYIGDLWLNRVRKVNTAGVISTFAGYGTATYCGDTGPATLACIYDPAGLTVNAAGDVLISDNTESIIYRVDTGGMIHQFAGQGMGSGYLGDGHLATSPLVAVHGPAGIVVDDSGNTYICDQNNNVVRKVNAAGIISTYAGNHTMGYTGDGGAATAAELNKPYNIAADHYGNIFIQDPRAYVIRKIDAAGIITRIAGNGTIGYSGDGGPALSAMLIAPAGMAVDAACNIYFCDYTRVRKISGIDAGATAICVGYQLAYTHLAPVSGLWQSSSPTVASIDTTGLVTGLSAGTTTIYYVVGSDTAFAPLTILPMPHASPVTGPADTLCLTDHMLLSDTSAGGEWRSSATGIATINSSGTVNGVAEGSCTLLYIVTNSCGIDTAAYTIYVVHCPGVSVPEADIEGKVIIWPNPATRVLNIQWDGTETVCLNETIIITNLLGQKVFDGPPLHVKNVQIDVSDLPAGVYFVKVNGVVNKVLIE